MNEIGPIAQSVEQQPFKLLVPGSSPGGPTGLIINQNASGSERCQRRKRNSQAKSLPLTHMFNLLVLTAVVWAIALGAFYLKSDSH